LAPNSWDSILLIRILFQFLFQHPHAALELGGSCRILSTFSTPPMFLNREQLFLYHLPPPRRCRQSSQPRCLLWSQPPAAPTVLLSRRRWRPWLPRCRAQLLQQLQLPRPHRLLRLRCQLRLRHQQQLPSQPHLEPSASLSVAFSLRVALHFSKTSWQCTLIALLASATIGWHWQSHKHWQI